MLLAYDVAGDVIATLDWLVAFDENDDAVGLVDFEATDPADVWEVDGAADSATWPEELGARAHDFRVETGGGRITALIHKASGHRRERADAVSRRPALDAEGRTKPPVNRPKLPLLGVRK